MARLHLFAAAPWLARIGELWAGSDKDLFATVPVSVAVNADHRLTPLATHSYVGEELWDAYELIHHAR